jgi:hypothetical protein
VKRNGPAGDEQFAGVTLMGEVLEGLRPDSRGVIAQNRVRGDGDWRRDPEAAEYGLNVEPDGGLSEHQKAD